VSRAFLFSLNWREELPRVPNSREWHTELQGVRGSRSEPIKQSPLYLSPFHGLEVGFAGAHPSSLLSPTFNTSDRGFARRVSRSSSQGYTTDSEDPQISTHVGSEIQSSVIFDSSWFISSTSGIRGSSSLHIVLRLPNTVHPLASRSCSCRTFGSKRFRFSGLSAGSRTRVEPSLPESD